MNKYLAGVITLALIAGCVIGCGQGPEKKVQVLAKVDDEVITFEGFENRLSQFPPAYKEFASTQKKSFLDDMIMEILLVKEATRRNLHKDKEVKEVLEEARKKILISKLMEDEAQKRVRVSEEEIKTFYESHPQDFVTPERLRVSHIMVDTEEEARQILAELNEGGDFEKIAKERSEDPSAEKGGDIGYFRKGQLLPEFEEACFKLRLGEMSGVVKTSVGYHIIKLTDRKEARSLKLDEVKSNITNLIENRKRKESFTALVERLKNSARIEIDAGFLRAEEEKAAKEIESEREIEEPTEEAHLDELQLEEVPLEMLEQK